MCWAELVSPCDRLGGRIVVDALIRVRGRVRDLAFHRHEPPVPQADRHVGLPAGHGYFSAELARSRCLGDVRDRMLCRLGEPASLNQEVLEQLLLASLAL